MKRLIIILIFSTIICCKQKDSGITNGTFELYEKDSLVGKIYRQGNYQIESYPDSKELIAKIKHNSDSTYLISGVEEVQKGIDSVIWLNSYTKLSNKKYRIKATSYNVKINYEYNAELVKVDNNIKKRYLKKLDSLNKK
jgi:head-tail adaptor